MALIKIIARKKLLDQTLQLIETFEWWQVKKFYKIETGIFLIKKSLLSYSRSDIYERNAVTLSINKLEEKVSVWKIKSLV